MFSTDFIFRQQENLVDNQKCQAGFRPLCNKILIYTQLKMSEEGEIRKRVVTYFNGHFLEARTEIREIFSLVF